MINRAKPKTQNARVKDKKRKDSKSSKTSKVKSPKTSKSRFQRRVKTMEELIKATNYKLRGLKKGELIEGIITDISKKTTLIDIGAKTEGIVIDKEYEISKEYIAQLKVGDKVQAMIISPENDKGQILLSLRKSALNHKWNLFDQYLKTEEIVEVRGLEVNKGGLIARFMGIRGFIPASQLGRNYLGQPETLQNKLFKAKVIEVNREKNRLIFSEKLVSEAASLEAKKKALKKVKKGDLYQGRVSGIMPFGIFIQIEDKGLFLEGLVHISEISWERVENLNKLFKVGQRIKVKVLGVDQANAKLNLSIKQLTEDPWAKLAKKYTKDKKAKGEVVRLVAFGAFVQLEPGVEGLIHISKIPAEYNIKVGKKIDVYVENIDLEKRRMSLGLVLKEKPVGYK